jgi:hypothetical protein
LGTTRRGAFRPALTSCIAAGVFRLTLYALRITIEG